MKPELRYEVVLYWSEPDEAFIAEVPELPGCAADISGPAADRQQTQIMLHGLALSRGGEQDVDGKDGPPEDR